ncbi:MAG: hypothetical protein LBL08_03355 [Candidatus Nomurabacteria bacterium]|jgi:hypothetical protein|nr:hypothetical protein [Candidatus Nomurabacteria bacterium]
MDERKLFTNKVRHLDEDPEIEQQAIRDAQVQAEINSRVAKEEIGYNPNDAKYRSVLRRMAVQSRSENITRY